MKRRYREYKNNARQNEYELEKYKRKRKTIEKKMKRRE